MPITRADVQKLSGEEYTERKAVLDRCVANDSWATKVFKKVAILINTYPGHRAYLRACVESHSKPGYFIAMAYDNYVDPRAKDVDHNSFMPDKGILDKIDLFIMPHHQTWKDVNYPYFWQLKWGSSALQQFEYIYCTEGDFVLDKPDGFDQLLSLMGDGDVMGAGPDFEDELHTGACIYRSSAFVKIVQYMQDHFIPFDKYEQYLSMGGAEWRAMAAIKEYGLKLVEPPVPGTWNCTHDLHGTWYDLVGLRHIQGELDYAYKFRLIPPHYKYIDGKYLDKLYNYALIKEYWDTNDEKVLDRWWKQ
jgi:hypothetical protein